MCLDELCVQVEQEVYTYIFFPSLVVFACVSAPAPNIAADPQRHLAADGCGQHVARDMPRPPARWPPQHAVCPGGAFGSMFIGA